MPHQCTHCGKIYPDAAKELLEGCSCESRFFYYIKQEKFDELNQLKDNDIQDTITELDKADKVQIEKDIREITGLDEEPEKPVILDLESIRVIKPGKFEIDIINLFSKTRPLIYKLEPGKYIIDLSSSFKFNKKEVSKKIRDPYSVLGSDYDKKKKETREYNRKKEEKKEAGEGAENIEEETKEEQEDDDGKKDNQKEENKTITNKTSS